MSIFHRGDKHGAAQRSSYGLLETEATRIDIFNLDTGTGLVTVNDSSKLAELVGKETKLVV